MAMATEAGVLLARRVFGVCRPGGFCGLRSRFDRPRRHFTDRITHEQGPPLHDDAKHLSWLLGAWQSKKADGFYPTIKSFEYKDKMEFSHAGQPILLCSFFATHLNGDPVHLENGFLRVNIGTNRVAYMSAQNIGVIEIEEGEVNGTTLHLESVALSYMSFAKHPRATKITRTFKLINESTLELAVSMATATHPDLVPHLSAVYNKIPLSL